MYRFLATVIGMARCYVHIPVHVITPMYFGCTKACFLNKTINSAIRQLGICGLGWDGQGSTLQHLDTVFWRKHGLIGL